MKIYTKTGDGGDASRPNGKRVRKTDPRIHAVGSLDELNAHVGLSIAAAAKHAVIQDALRPLQAELLVVGAIVATAGTESDPGVALESSAVERMEQQIDRAAETLGERTHFILSGGCELACRLHLARTVCRRAERAIVGAADGDLPVPAVVLQYVNRLSDLLFVLARVANRREGVEDVIWSPREETR